MMKSTLSITVADPLARSRMYKLLSSGFRYPGSEMFSRFQSREYAAELWEGLASLSHLGGPAEKKEAWMAAFDAALDGATHEDFEVKYARTFDVGDLEPPCPPYEGLQRDDVDRVAVMLEVSEFYKLFGLKMSPAEGKRDVPDNLCAELEFLHFLTFKEAQARQEGDRDLLRGYLLAQKDFLERHLAKWVPAFGEKLRKQAEVPFYHELAAVTSTFITAELEAVQSMLLDFAAGQP